MSIACYPGQWLAVIGFLPGSTTVGWMQQWSCLGQFASPPLVAAVATAAGGWQFTWLATGVLCILGRLLAARLSTRPRADH